MLLAPRIPCRAVLTFFGGDRKLTDMTLQPAFQILRRAVRMALRHSGFFVRVSLPWLLILLVLPLFLVIASGGGRVSATEGTAASVSLGMAVACYMLLCLMVMIYLAIAWFRRTLPYGNPKLRRRLPTALDVLDFGAVLLRIFIYLSPIAVMLALATLGAVMLFAVWMVNALEAAPEQLLDLRALSPFQSPVGVPMAIILLSLWFRLSVALSSAAVGKRDVDLTRAWLMTRGLSRQFAAAGAGIIIAMLVIGVFTAVLVNLLAMFFVTPEHSLLFIVLRYTLEGFALWACFFAALAASSGAHAHAMAKLREGGLSHDGWRSENGLVRA